MKFTSSFAVLAVLLASGLVNATPIPRDTADLDVRELTEAEVQDVWARSFDDELDAREFLDFEDDLSLREFLDFEEDLSLREFLDFADDYLEVRADKIAKGAKKIGETIYSNSGNIVNAADKQAKASKSVNPPGPSPAQRAHEAAKKAKRELLDFDDYLEARADKIAKAAGKIGEAIYSNAPNMINAADKQLKASHSTNARNTTPSPAQRAHAAAKAQQKKREFLDIDEYLEARADKIAKAAGKIGEAIYSNAPNMINAADKQLKASHSTNTRNTTPSPAQRAHAAAKAQQKKREFLDIDEYLEARADKIAKAAGKIGEAIYSNAPNMINAADKQIKASHSTNTRNTTPSPAQRAHAAVKAQQKK